MEGKKHSKKASKESFSEDKKSKSGKGDDNLEELIENDEECKLFILFSLYF